MYSFEEAKYESVPFLFLNRDIDKISFLIYVNLADTQNLGFIIGNLCFFFNSYASV